jgi:hypothetical protein
VPLSLEFATGVEPMNNAVATIIMHAALAVFVFASASVCEAKTPSCEKQATEDARKLLNFHSDGDERIEIDSNVKKLHPIKNPAAPSQKFDVYEVWGQIYKGTYRMRLIYYPMDASCVLMGQEILEFAKP